MYNLTISASRNNKKSSIKFNACSWVMPIFPYPRFYSSLTFSLSITLSLRPHAGFYCHDAIIDSLSTEVGGTSLDE